MSHPGRAHDGSGTHSATPDHNPLVRYELSGAVRWVDRDGSRFVVRVAEANGHAGRWLGRDVTVEPSDDGPELLPGAEVQVVTRLPRDIDAQPDPLVAHSVRILT